MWKIKWVPGEKENQSHSNENFNVFFISHNGFLCEKNCESTFERINQSQVSPNYLQYNRKIIFFLEKS